LTIPYRGTVPHTTPQRDVGLPRDRHGQSCQHGFRKWDVLVWRLCVKALREWGSGLLGGGHWSGLSEVSVFESYGGACSVDGSLATEPMPQFRMYCALAWNHADSQMQS
jgi:hypothetical protein